MARARRGEVRQCRNDILGLPRDTAYRGGEEFDYVLNGVVGAVVSGFEFAGRLVSGVGAVVKAAVCEGSAGSGPCARPRSAPRAPLARTTSLE
jgi:hypothetical protein